MKKLLLFLVFIFINTAVFAAGEVEIGVNTPPPAEQGATPNADDQQAQSNSDEMQLNSEQDTPVAMDT